MSPRLGRRPKKYSQAERITRMMRALASRGMTVNELAEEFGITRRQVYRDLLQIEEEGHPLTQSADNAERTWHLPLGYHGLPPITVSPYELMSLYLARAHLAYLSGTPFVEDLDAVVKKVEAALPAKTANHLQRIVQTFVPLIRPVRNYGAQQAVLQTLRKALLLQQRVVVHYRKPNYDSTLAQTIEPYGLVLYQQGLYVVGHSHYAGALRTFAVERIEKVEPTEQRFEIPPTFSIDALGSRAFGLIEDEPQEVRVQFDPEVAYLVKERRWHPTQMIKTLNDGRVLMTFHAGGQDEIVSWILSWGAKARVLGPPALVKAVADELMAARKRYTNPSRRR